MNPTEAEQKAFIALKQLYETVTIAYYSGVSDPLLWHIKLELDGLEKAYDSLKKEKVAAEEFKDKILSNASERQNELANKPHRHSIHQMGFERVCVICNKSEIQLQAEGLDVF